MPFESWVEGNAGGGGGRAHAASAVTCFYRDCGQQRQPEIRCVRRLPLRRIEPSFDFTRKIRSCCIKVLAVYTIKIEMCKDRNEPVI